MEETKDEGSANEPSVEASDDLGESEKRPAARSWRRVFEEDFHPLDVDARVQLARNAEDADLRALCFDPSFRVVEAVLDNARSGLEHARLIAQHHRTSNGLDSLGQRAAFLRDSQVQRHLFRNPQLSPRLLRRIFQTRRMAEVYRLCLSRESTERVRAAARKELRQKFNAGTAEERVSLILRCEGRCLNLLLGLALGNRATALLAQRSFHSTLLIQNLARWPSTPPAVIQQMARAPMVQRSPMLRNLVARHPNAPSQLKRQG